jgi:hypothetical protein
MEKIKASIKCAAFVLAAVLSTQAQGSILVESLNNTVADGAIVINPSRTDWTNLTPYVSDPNENSSVDWSQVTIANDSSNLYIRYLMNASTGLNTSTMFFIDTDSNRDTGYIGGSSQFSIGAEYMIQGATIYSFIGSTPITWDWNFIGGVNYDTFPNTDMTFSLALSQIGSPTTFSFLLFSTGDILGSYYEDYYVDNANLGAAGGYLSYTTVPEPTTTALLLGGLALAGVRTLRRFRR